MTVTYTWDSSPPSTASAPTTATGASSAGPEFPEHRAPLFDTEQRMVFGAASFQEAAQIMCSGIDPDSPDE